MIFFINILFGGLFDPLRGSRGSGSDGSPAFSFFWRKKKKLRQKEKSLPAFFSQKASAKKKVCKHFLCRGLSKKKKMFFSYSTRFAGQGWVGDPRLFQLSFFFKKKKASAKKKNVFFRIFCKFEFPKQQFMDFDPLSIRHRELFVNAVSSLPVLSCDFSFATIFTWKRKFQSEIALFHNSIIVKFRDSQGKTAFLAPLGGNVSEATQAIIDYCNQRNIELKIYAITQDFLQRLTPTVREKLDVTFDRDQAEYIYRRADLASLEGGKLKKKRNHVNRFLTDYPTYEVEEITHRNIKSCEEIYWKWRRETEDRGDNTVDIEDEKTALYEAFAHFEELHLRGLLLKINGQNAAFAFGEMVTETCFLTHTEKALTEYAGVYAMINKLTAETVAHEATYINREEDMGIENLRKAKMSYFPEFLLEKATASLAEAHCNAQILMKHLDARLLAQRQKHASKAIANCINE